MRPPGGATITVAPATRLLRGTTTASVASTNILRALAAISSLSQATTSDANAEHDRLITGERGD